MDKIKTTLFESEILCPTKLRREEEVVELNGDSRVDVETFHTLARREQRLSGCLKKITINKMRGKITATPVKRNSIQKTGPGHSAPTCGQQGQREA